MKKKTKTSTLVKKDKLGYYTLAKIPGKSELEKYYQKKYYQAQDKYSSVYTRDEIVNIKNKLDQKFQVIKKHFKNNKSGAYSLLDIGAGEGWTLKYFKGKKWDVTGIDFSSFGTRTHNPQLLKNLIAGDIDHQAQKLISQKKKYDLIWLDNVLEHVTNPAMLLKMCKKLAKPKGMLIVEVPNDFSEVQKHLLKNRFVEKPYWVISPDHISYFNSESLNKICKSQGWENFDMIADFPIDFFLFNKHTNYVKNKEIGKESHMARVRIENFIADLPENADLDFYRALAKAGLGRQIIGFYKSS